MWCHYNGNGKGNDHGNGHGNGHGKCNGNGKCNGHGYGNGHGNGHGGVTGAVTPLSRDVHAYVTGRSRKICHAHASVTSRLCQVTSRLHDSNVIFTVKRDLKKNEI